jgi:hypothetical protein
MLSLILRRAVPSKHSEHTHQGLMRTLSIRSGTDAFAEHASGTDAYPEHTHQFLKGPSKHADHARKELMRALSVYVRN